jgi:hypothetical protein
MIPYLRSSSGSLAIFAAIRRASSRVSNLDVQFSAKLLDEGTSRRRVGKAPPKIDLGFFYNSPSVPHLNVSRFMKMQHPAV